MKLIEFKGETIIVNLRKDGTTRTVSPLFVEIYNEWGNPAQFILPDGLKYVEEVLVNYQPDIGDLLTITFVLKEETLPRSQLVTPLYIMEKDANGRVTSLKIPYVSRWADPEIVEEISTYTEGNTSIKPTEGTETPSEEIAEIKEETPTEEVGVMEEVEVVLKEEPAGEIQ
ncbi:MAG: hypothetical protein QW815_00045 [Nitrososphaerota archaeon]